jgi:hypothetical protein
MTNSVAYSGPSMTLVYVDPNLCSNRAEALFFLAKLAIGVC